MCQIFRHLLAGVHIITCRMTPAKKWRIIMWTPAKIWHNIRWTPLKIWCIIMRTHVKKRRITIWTLAKRSNHLPLSQEALKASSLLWSTGLWYPKSRITLFPRLQWSLLLANDLFSYTATIYSRICNW